MIRTFLLALVVACPRRGLRRVVGPGLLSLIATACVQPSPPPVSTSVLTTSATVVPGQPPIGVVVRGPPRAAYRAEILGSKPENVAVEITNEGDTPRDVSDLRIAFFARRGAVPFVCDTSESMPPREPKTIAPHATETFEREMCSLPLPENTSST